MVKLGLKIDKEPIKVADIDDNFRWMIKKFMELA
jgi:hypothetical protein